MTTSKKKNNSKKNNARFEGTLLSAILLNTSILLL
jgi:hypothetical protein